MRSAVLRRVLAPMRRLLRRRAPSNASYWTSHNVTQHRRFRTREQSLDYLSWRNAQYLFYDELIPYEELAGLDVLDYGCGPGHDLVAITERAQARSVIGLDISPASLAEARDRLRLHGVAEPVLHLVDEHDPTLPLADASVDFVLSSGVLHHCPNVDAVLGELHRVLRPGGRGRVMVYNRHSLWLHLYVAYTRQLVAGIDRTLSIDEAFKRSTDGPECPWSVAYTPTEFIELATRCGFTARDLGAAVSVHELSLLDTRFAAIKHPDLAVEHRDFLTTLTFDDHGRPLHHGRVAGIDGFFEIVKPD